MLRALIKLLRGVWHALIGFFTIYTRFPVLSLEQRNARVQVWAMQMLRICGIELRVLGKPVVSGPALLICNHISWLDILVIHATRHCRFVSKSELRDWPVLGTMATGAGTLYIARSQRRDALRMVHEMAQALKQGEVVAVFPEGTTSDGLGLLPFHANLIQSAIAANAPVQTLALQFVDGRTGKISMAARYIDDDSLLVSVWRTLNAKGLQAVVNFGDLQTAQGRGRREWAHDLRLKVMQLKLACLLQSE